MNKTLTVRNTENQEHFTFIQSVFRRIEQEIRKEAAYEFRIILFTRKTNGTWTVDGTPILIEFEDGYRTDIQHVTIREEATA